MAVALLCGSPAVSLAQHSAGAVMQRGSVRESAFARGYDDGHRQGLRDGREGTRYDPVRHREYRDGDQGYGNEYGSRDAYRNNYRAGFRQGYDDGYREGSGRR